ncbi:TPA: helix-turn-helix transcriptional regulator [Candidatus Galligastranaerophilus intestinigallinarum]|nr:helix-turn-helix transcriptional regulator [Candidatus Galligastranaerophilus intestinigallinarum]
MQNYEVMYHKFFAKKIREIRKANKLSQEKFAEKLDCSREFISRLENNKEKLSLKLLLKLAHVFNINLREFFAK